MALVRAAKLIAWLGSAAMFGVVLGFAIAFVIFIFTWHDCGPEPSKLILWIPIVGTEAVGLPLAVREWRSTRGAPPGYLWWLVIGFGPAVIAGSLLVALLRR